MPPNTAPKDTRRKLRRISTLKTGTLTLVGDNQRFDCFIRNLNENGAKLKVGDPSSIPDLIELQLDDGTRHRCQVVWRERSELGVYFVDEASLTRDARGDDARDQMLREGQIIFQDGNCTMDCTILNLSRMGALILPRDPISCPDIFDLRVRHGPSFACRVIRRQRNEIGVRFLET